MEIVKSDVGMHWKMVKLGDVLDYEQPTNYIVASDLYDDKFEIPVLTAGKSFILGYTDETNGIFSKLPVIIFDDFTTVSKYVDFPFKVKSSAMKILKAKEGVADTRYMFYLLQTLNLDCELHKRYWISKFAPFQIILPPLPIQKRIAEILDAADALKRKDQELLKKYDELAQAIFIDMFGDPVKNEKGWEVKKLGEICTKITDGTHDTPERLTEGVKFITGKHIRPYVIDYDNSDYVTSIVHKEIFKRCNPEFGDILYTNIGVNYATAAMNIVNYEFSMKNVALLKYDRQILSGRFLEYQLNNEFFKDKLKKLTGIGGAQQFLSLAQIKAIVILVPEISLQKEFEKIINTLFNSIGKLNISNQVTGNLFQTLIQKAFKGELVAE